MVSSSNRECVRFASAKKLGMSERAAEGKRGNLFLLPSSIRFSFEDALENSFSTEPCGCGKTTKRWLKSYPGRGLNIFKGMGMIPRDMEVVTGNIPDTTMMYQLVIDSRDMGKLKLKIEAFRKLSDPLCERSKNGS